MKLSSLKKFANCVIITSFLVLVFNGCKEQQSQPNIIFFLVDDLGWKDISANGSELYETPNIDMLISESTYFTNAYAAYPRCVPSRYAMMSGNHPARNSLEGSNNKVINEITIGEAFQSNGYGTFYTGKWHLGFKNEEWPHFHGFDVNKGGCDAGEPPSYFYPYGDLYGLEEGETGEYITDRLTDETIKYIKDNTETPFFAYVAHYGVHTPFQAKKDRVDYYSEKIKKLNYTGEPYTYGEEGKCKMWQDNAIYAAMIESVDESLGRIIQTLKDLNLYENTIIIFTSDHGGLSNTGADNQRPLATSNLPLRAGKGHNYEGGIKVPVLVRWPDVVGKVSSTDVIITGMDYYPSLLEMAGLPLQPDQHLDGVSFAAALKNNKTDEDRYFYWHQTSARPHMTGDHNSSVIRQGNFKLHHFLDNDQLELYDLSVDPYEKRNLADQNPELTRRLLNQLEVWKTEANVDNEKNN